MAYEYDRFEPLVELSTRAQYRSTRHEVLLCMAAEIVVWLWSFNKMIDLDLRMEATSVAMVGIGYIWMRAMLGYLMHRCGAFHKKLEIEAGIQQIGWEHLKPTSFMAIVGIGASIPQLCYTISSIWWLKNHNAAVEGLLLLAVFMLGLIVTTIAPLMGAVKQPNS